MMMYYAVIELSPVHTVLFSRAELPCWLSQYKCWMPLSSTRFLWKATINSCES